MTSFFCAMAGKGQDLPDIKMARRRGKHHRTEGVAAPGPTTEADTQAGQALTAAILSQTGEGLGAKEPKGCRFIEGSVRAGDWRYCQQPQEPGSAYCAHHHHRCYSRRVSGGQSGASAPSTTPKNGGSRHG